MKAKNYEKELDALLREYNKTVKLTNFEDHWVAVLCLTLFNLSNIEKSIREAETPEERRTYINEFERKQKVIREGFAHARSQAEQHRMDSWEKGHPGEAHPTGGNDSTREVLQRVQNSMGRSQDLQKRGF